MKTLIASSSSREILFPVLKMEVVRSVETLAPLLRTARRHVSIPKDGRLALQRKKLQPCNADQCRHFFGIYNFFINYLRL